MKLTCITTALLVYTGTSDQNIIDHCEDALAPNPLLILVENRRVCDDGSFILPNSLAMLLPSPRSILRMKVVKDRNAYNFMCLVA